MIKVSVCLTLLMPVCSHAWLVGSQNWQIQAKGEDEGTDKWKNKPMVNRPNLRDSVPDIVAAALKNKI